MTECSSGSPQAIGQGRFAAQAPLWVTSDGIGCRVDRLRPHTDRLGVKLVVREQSFGREIDVDQCLLDEIHATLNTQQPGVLVVATGDGAGYFQNTGFLRAVEQARGTGWAVEVLAWGKTCHGPLRSFAAGGHGFTDLANHYNSISFVEGGRRSTEISWRRRSVASFPTAQRAA